MTSQAQKHSWVIINNLRHVSVTGTGRWYPWVKGREVYFDSSIHHPLAPKWNSMAGRHNTEKVLMLRWPESRERKQDPWRERHPSQSCPQTTCLFPTDPIHSQHISSRDPISTILPKAHLRVPEAFVGHSPSQLTKLHFNRLEWIGNLYWRTEISIFSVRNVNVI